MSEYSWFQISGMAVAVIALCVLPWTWKVFITHIITLAHEYGHAFTGVFTSGRIRQIKIRTDASGETNTIRASRLIPFGATITTLLGYPAPIILGSLMLSAAGEPWMSAIIIGLFVFGLFCLLFIRNFFGLLMALLWIGTFGFFITSGNLQLTTTSMIFIGMLLIAGGIKDFVLLFIMWKEGDGEGSDLGIIKDNVYFPQIFSYILMIAMTVAGSWGILLI